MSQELAALVEKVVWRDQAGEMWAYRVRLAGEKAHPGDWIYASLAERSIDPVIPCGTGQVRESRPGEFERAVFRARSIAERFIGWLKESRRILTRLEKPAINLLAMVN